MNMRIIIAIDGHSSCGKSTTARRLASDLGYAYVDSGAMYRVVTLYFLQNEIDTSKKSSINSALSQIVIRFKFNEETARTEAYLNSKNVEQAIRGYKVSENVSRVAAIKDVRAAMVLLQREAGKDKCIVMDGRDIGSNVFPTAELKVFMTAELEIRAKRRHLELMERGQIISLKEVKENLIKRDKIDSGREFNPLIQVADAKVLDTSYCSLDEQLEIVKKWYDQVINPKD